MSKENLMVFTGNATPALAESVASHLDIPLGKATVGRFSDGEVMVEINENVRGKDVFVLQSTCAPTNDNLMEMMVMIDALKRASAGRITAAIPLLRIRPPRSPRAFFTSCNHCQSGGQHATSGRRRSRIDYGLARRPDSGLF